MREEYVYESPPLPPDEDVYSEKIPAAVELLISYLEVAGLSTDDLFGGDPTVRELNDVIGSLSSGRTRDVAAVCRGSAQLAAASLAAYIRSLPEPLVGPPHYEALCAAVDIEPYGERVASVRDTLGGMPESTQTVLHRLFRFLSTLASRSAARGNSAEALAQVWTAMITPTYERGRALLRNEFRLVGLLLQQYACIFEGSLDAYEAPELPLPATLAGGGGNWVRTKASLLRDSQGWARRTRRVVRDSPPPPHTLSLSLSHTHTHTHAHTHTHTHTHTRTHTHTHTAHHAHRALALLLPCGSCRLDV